MRNVIVILIVCVAFGCAKVSIETKEPIKVDINMKVDVYQHVVKDVQSINDQIYGSQHEQYNHIFMIQQAYAEDSSADLQAAISRRRNRLKQIEEYFVMGYVGENRNALLEVRSEIPSSEKATVEAAVKAENADRNTIYEGTAQKNNTDLSQVRKVFFKDDYDRALSGFLFEVLKEGKYVWQEK